MKTFLARTIVFVTFAAVSVVAPHRVAAQSLATPTGRTNITTEATAKINAVSRAPIPVAPRQVILRPDLQWVPDRYVSVPGAPQGVLVPGHWERRTASGEVHVPPLPITMPGGGLQTIPAGVRAPADQRLDP